MDERAVRAAAERIWHEGHGLFMGTGEECRMVPVSALDDLFEAVGFGRRDPSPFARLIDAAISTPLDVSTD